MDKEHVITEKIIRLAMKVQPVNYLVATNRKFGLLINFGAPSLQFKRKHRDRIADAADVDLHHPVSPVNPI